MPKKTYQLKQRAESVGRTRARIAAAAAGLHEELGPSRTTISDIARRAGVDRVTVYRHFPDDASLFQACSAHFAATHPLPDTAQWSREADPRVRLERALSAIYRYFETTEAMLANVTRDAHHMPAVSAAGERRREWFSDVAEGLSQGWGGDRRRARDAIALALEFATWETLIRKRHLTPRSAVRLMASMVAGAAS